MNYEHTSDQGGNHIIIEVHPYAIKARTSMPGAAEAIVNDRDLRIFPYGGGTCCLRVKDNSIVATITKRSSWDSPHNTAIHLREAAEKYLGELLDRYHETEVFLKHLQGKK